MHLARVTHCGPVEGDQPGPGRLRRHPTPQTGVHLRATATGRRHGLRLGRVKPVGLGQVLSDGDLVVAVCDNVHEELDPGRDRLHW